MIGGVQAFLLIGQIVALVWTIRQTRAAVAASQRSAKAAEDAVSGTDALLNHSKDSSEKELRAYVFVNAQESNATPGGINLPIKIENFGATPAYGLRLCYDAFIAQEQNPKDIPSVDFGIFGAKSDLGPGSFTTSHFNCPLNNLDGLMLGLQTLFFYGGVMYKDAFGVDRETYFRFHMTFERTDISAWRVTAVPHYEGNYAT